MCVCVCFMSLSLSLSLSFSLSLCVGVRYQSMVKYLATILEWVIVLSMKGMFESIPFICGLHYAAFCLIGFQWLSCLADGPFNSG